MLKNRYIIIVILCVISLQTFSQSEPLRIKRKEFKHEKYGFKEAWRAIREANWLYKKGVGSFREARELYLKANKYNSDNAELNYMIGKTFLFTDNKFVSINYMQKAFELNPEVNDDIHLMLGMAYHQINEFDNAIEEYQMFLKNMNPKDAEQYTDKTNLLIRQCKFGRDLVLDPQRVVINNLGENVNSVYDEYTPVITFNADEMYFTSRRQYSEKSIRSFLDDKFFEDVYFTENKNGKWTRAQRIDKKFIGKKNKKNVAVVGRSLDENTLYFYIGKNNEGDIYSSIFNAKKGKWSKPKPMKKFNTNSRETSICMSSDENTVYFISSNEKESFGGTDIFYCIKNAKGKWSKPMNVGNVVNTHYDEVGISLSANDSVMYFSSQGHNSIGGYDVFRTKMEKVGLWSKPENLGYPINTPTDDVFYVEMPDAKTAYYSTNRESGVGGLDIYKIIYLGSEKEMVISSLSENLAGLVPPADNIYFDEVVPLDIDTRLVMRGFINDSENGDPVIAKIELIDQESNQVIAIGISDSTGNYTMKIPEAKTYGLDIVAKGYLLLLDVADLSQETYDEVIVRNFKLDRVEVGAKVVLKNIYFETGKANLKEESFASLDNVIKLLQNNETLRIEIAGHTDNVGSNSANQKLSAERAKSVVSYLVKQGIKDYRLTYKGYGESEPIAPNDTEDGRAQNRRVEFKILSK